MGLPIAAAAFHPPCTGHDYDQAGKAPIAQDDAEACADLVGALTSDAHRLLGHLPERELAAHPAGQSPCWRWSPGRTWSRPRTVLAPPGGGAWPGGSPLTGSSPPSTPTPGMRTRPSLGARRGVPAST